MNEEEILKFIENKKDKSGRIITRYIPDIIIDFIKPLYKNSDSLNKNEIISTFYRGHREVEKCLKDDCNNFKKWDKCSLIFRNYCCTKCSNSDPKKDEITVKNNMEKYGVPRASMTQESKDKLLNTNLEKFGYVSSAQHQSVKDKAFKTNMKKYGFNSTEVGNIQNLEDYNNKDFIIKNFIKDDCFLKNEFMMYFNCGQVAAHTTLSRLGIEYKKFGSLKETYIERLFKTFLEENNINYVDHYRDKFEIDFFLPDYNIGIEIDGLYFHSYGKNGHNFNRDKKWYKYRHKIKKDYFQERGIQIIFIWENEILKKFDIWKSMILSKINKTQRKIGARECKIKLINNEIKKVFLFDNHIQGSRQSSINLGLYFKDELVAAMTFGKSVLNINFDFELIRFATLKNTNISGGASKLLKYFEEHYKPESIITYLNRRWSIDNTKFYPKLGFTLNNDSGPNKFILDRQNFLNIKNRLQFQKHKLKNIDNFIYDDTITADENIVNNGYRIIWDCGNIVYHKHFNKVKNE